MARILASKNVVLGVTGSIAAYKAVELASSLVKAGVVVDVIMTEAATELVKPLSFQAITHRPVVTEMFSLLAETANAARLLGKTEFRTDIRHVTLAKKADALLVAPVTANTIAKLATGLADNMLTVTALATEAPIVLAPAMETAMYQNAVTQANLDRLRQRGVRIVEPGVGRLASGRAGLGRLAELHEILGALRMVLGRGGDLTGYHVLVTAGGTRESLDPVRFLTNHSSGSMGYALAEAARDRGAEVTLISAPTGLTIPIGVQHISVVTAEEMAEAVIRVLPEADVVLMAAAVADFRPVHAPQHKIKKGDGGLTLELVRTRDILTDVAEMRRSPQASLHSPLVVVGFAAETENLVANAQDKLAAKNLDLIVANPVPASFGPGRVEVTLVDRKGAITELPLMTKDEVAERVLDRVVTLLSEG